MKTKIVIPSLFILFFALTANSSPTNKGARLSDWGDFWQAVGKLFRPEWGGYVVEGKKTRHGEELDSRSLTP